MSTPARRLFPPHGPGYELFDTATLILALGLIGYVFTDPPMVTQNSLPPLRLVSETALGVFITVAGLIGVVASYVPRLYRLGYIVTITASLAMCANFTAGAIDQHELRPMVSAILYGWIARRLMRDNSEVR